MTFPAAATLLHPFGPVLCAKGWGGFDMGKKSVRACVYLRVHISIYVCVCECECRVAIFFIYLCCLFLPIYLCLPAEECSYWLPLYGSMCCRLAAQPHCMTQQMMSGCLKVKVSWQGVCVCAAVMEGLFLSRFPLFWAFFQFISTLSSYSPSYLCTFPFVFNPPLTDLLLYLAAVGWWPSELDRSVRRSKRNQPFLLPQARRRGGERWASSHHRHQQGQQRKRMKNGEM